ncbi:MAG: type II toxin-antitoxin system Phd/YefM family antitoxin [Spirochaetales bacterium]|nr:type II toxin-antitoxin system Phd/YefM family antitoxin [Spirochaetales bacterium]MBR5098988.1 type II toxin-antitoxin system Phd/YefM family antitoxin [Spirochaetales bacterium]
MPNIKPVSDLRNYAEVLSEVHENEPVYLTKNGRGCYAIVDMDYINEYERLKAEIRFFNEVYSAEKRAEKEGWISSDDVKRRLGIEP